MSISGKYFSIDKSCFLSPPDTKNEDHGYFVQGAILLQFAWPDMSCRNDNNDFKFAGTNFDKRIEILIRPFSIDRNEYYQKQLFIATNPLKFALGSTVIENEFSVENGERIYSLPPDKNNISQTDKIYSLEDSYITYCNRLAKKHARLYRDCHSIIFYENYVIQIEFDYAHFGDRFRIEDKSRQFIKFIESAQRK